MNKKIIYILFLVLVGINSNINAQVTVGSDIPPSKGALLDLKQSLPDIRNVTSTKGLLMPRVKLTNEDSLDGFIDGVVSEVDKKAHTGLVVYSITSPSPTTCPGPFVWGGEKWIPLYGEDYCPIISDAEGNAYHYKKYGNLYWITSNIRSIMKTRIEPIDKNGLSVNIQNTHLIVNEKTDLNQQVSYSENGTLVNLTLSDFLTKFGFLYTRDQAQKACPNGWRLATSQDWIDLANLFKGVDVAGRYLKSDNAVIGDKEWNKDASADGSDNSGINILPSGVITDPSAGAHPVLFGTNASFWCLDPMFVYFPDYTSKVNFYEGGFLGGIRMSVRCVKSAN